jgi:hypothetical protein
MYIRLIPVVSGVIGAYHGYNENKCKQINKNYVYGYLATSTTLINLGLIGHGIGGFFGCLIPATVMNGLFYTTGYLAGKII